MGDLESAVAEEDLDYGSAQFYGIDKYHSLECEAVPLLSNPANKNSFVHEPKFYGILSVLLRGYHASDVLLVCAGQRSRPSEGVLCARSNHYEDSAWDRWNRSKASLELRITLVSFL